MLDAAEVLARGTAFPRVDFYEVGERPYLGGFCLFPARDLIPSRRIGSTFNSARCGWSRRHK